MAHPSRRERAERLRDRLGHSSASARIAYDPQPDGSSATLRTMLAACSQMADDATHHLVVQDDVEPCADFDKRLTALVQAAPDEVLSLFAEWGSITATMVRWGALGGAGLVECVDGYVPTQAVVLPRDLVPEFVAYAQSACTWDTPDDVALRRFLAARGQRAFVAVPNLVEHDWKTSLLGHGAQGPRHATCLAAADDPPQSTVRLTAPDLIPTQTWSKGRAICVPYRVDDPEAGPPLVTRRVLQDAGMPNAKSAALLDLELARLVGETDLELRLGYPLIHELWTTGLAFAALAPTASAPGPQWARPGPGERALATTAPGALRCFAAPGLLAECAPALRKVLSAAVELGLGLRTDRDAAAPGTNGTHP